MTRHDLAESNLCSYLHTQRLPPVLSFTWRRCSIIIKRVLLSCPAQTPTCSNNRRPGVFQRACQTHPSSVCWQNVTIMLILVAFSIILLDCKSTLSVCFSASPIDCSVSGHFFFLLHSSVSLETVCESKTDKIVFKDCNWTLFTKLSGCSILYTKKIVTAQARSVYIWNVIAVSEGNFNKHQYE